MASNTTSRSAALTSYALLFVVFTAAAYYGLVIREQQEVARVEAQAAFLEDEVKKAREYLQRRASDEVVRREVERAAEEVKTRVPTGRVDFAVGQFLREKATALELWDFKYDVVGGIDVAMAAAPAEADGEAARLSRSPKALKAADIQVAFRGPFPQVFAFMKAMADAPWIIQVTNLDLRRSNIASDESDLDITARLNARYYHE